MENWIFLFLAYTAGWLGVLFYIFLNSRKQATIERKIKDLESMLAHKDGFSLKAGLEQLPPRQ